MYLCQIKFVFAVTETGTNAAAGDYFTALELGTALHAKYGWQVEYRAKGADWYHMAGVDVLVAMVHDFVLPEICNAKLTLITVAWARNWFERWASLPWIASYSLLLASSRSAADYLSSSTTKLARLLRIATNPARFDIAKKSNIPLNDYVFTGATNLTQNAIWLVGLGNGTLQGERWHRVS